MSRAPNTLVLGSACRMKSLGHKWKVASSSVPSAGSVAPSCCLSISQLIGFAAEARKRAHSEVRLTREKKTKASNHQGTRIATDLLLFPLHLKHWRQDPPILPSPEGRLHERREIDHISRPSGALVELPQVGPPTRCPRLSPSAGEPRNIQKLPSRMEYPEAAKSGGHQSQGGPSTCAKNSFSTLAAPAS